MPPERNGSPKWRAIWPVQSSPMPDSGVPKVGEPDCMSMLDRNEPKMTGQPGWIVWARAMPVSASAICCTSAAGMVTGDIAPIRMNGVSTTAWLASAYSKSASSIRSSQRSGELQLISEIVAGVWVMLSRPNSRPLPPPNRIEASSRVSFALGPETTLPMKILSVSVASA